MPKAPGLRPGAVPRRLPADETVVGREVAPARPSVPFSGDLFSFQGAILARRTKAFVQIGRRTRRAEDLEPCRRRVWPPGYRCPAPSCAVVRTAFAPEIKRTAPLRKRLERSWTHESPVQTVENARLERSSKDIAWPKATYVVTCVGFRPLWPSIHRWLRSQFASLCRMTPKYMDAEPICEEPNAEFHICVIESGQRR